MSRAAIAAPLGLAIAGFAACSSKSEPTKVVAQPGPPSDARIDGITMIPGFDPTSGMHLDDDGSGII